MMSPPKLISHFFFLLVTSFGMLNSKKWVGVGVGRLLKRAVPKKLLQGKGFTDAPASFHLKPQTQKGV